MKCLRAGCNGRRDEGDSRSSQWGLQQSLRRGGRLIKPLKNRFNLFAHARYTSGSWVVCGLERSTDISKLPWSCSAAADLPPQQSSDYPCFLTQKPCNAGFVVGEALYFPAGYAVWVMLSMFSPWVSLKTSEGPPSLVRPLHHRVDHSWLSVYQQFVQRLEEHQVVVNSAQWGERMWWHNEWKMSYFVNCFEMGCTHLHKEVDIFRQFNHSLNRTRKV